MSDPVPVADAPPALRVCPLAPGDELGLVALFREMQAHYRVPCPPDAEILADLHGLPAGVTLLVAHDPGVIGVAALAVVWPGPGLRRGLFLKELFVTASRRGQGIGGALIQAAARLAVESGAGRIDWTADRDDAPLLAFYQSLNAAELPKKLFFRLNGDALRTLAERLHIGKPIRADQPETV